MYVGKHTLTFSLLMLTAASPVYAADLYRWQDDQGNVHYTDRVPPEYLKRGYSVISEQGLTIQTIKPKQETEAKPKEPEPPRISAAQLRKDQRLLTTYASEKEIITARDRRLADIQALIDLSEETISLLDLQFRELTKEASDFEKQGKAIPEALLAQTAAAQKKIAKYQTRIEQNRLEMARLKQEFDEDLARYRELKEALE